MSELEAQLADACSDGIASNLTRWFEFIGASAGDLIELQALEVPQHRGAPCSMYAHATSIRAAAGLLEAAEQWQPNAPALYLILNRLDERIGRRDEPNKWHRAGRGSTSDRDVRERLVVPIDLDVIRPKGTSSTDGEVAASVELARKVRGHLVGLIGDRCLAYGNSGNGRWLAIALDRIAESSEVRELVRGILAGLKERFATPQVEIDVACSDAKRLGPAWGSVKRKGRATPETPHRATGIVTPANPHRLSLDELKALHSQLAPQTKLAKAATRSHSSESPFDLANAVPIYDVASELGLEPHEERAHVIVNCPRGCSGGTSVVLLDGVHKCSHSTCADVGPPGSSGVRTAVDLWAEVRRTTPLEAAQAICAWRGIALPERRPAPARVAPIRPVRRQDDWQQPLPIGRDAAVPEFPLHALPKWIADFVAAEAASVQVPIDMPAAFALGALAAVIGGHVHVRAWDGFEEACNLYIAVAMPPASTKSPVHKHVTAPITRFEEALQGQAQPAVAAAQSRRAVAEKRLKRAEDKAAKSSDHKTAMREVDNAREMLDTEVVPVLPRLIVDDTTPEQLKTLLAQHSGRLAMMSAESALFGNVASTRYSANPNLEAVLAGHSGDELRIDRRNRAEVVKDPRLTICIAIQPAVLRQAHENQMARERGLFARFLYCIPTSNIGFRDLSVLPPEVPSWLREEWDRKVREIASAMHHAGEVLVLRLSDEARSKFQAWRARHEPKLRPDGELVSLEAWAAKLPGHVLRLAGLLTVAGAPSGTVGLPALEAAIELASYFTAHAQIAFDSMGEDEGAANARKVAAWIRSRGKPSFTRSEATIAFKGRLTADALTPVLDHLTSLHWLRLSTQPGPSRPTKVYQVNPMTGLLGSKTEKPLSAGNPNLGYGGRSSEVVVDPIYLSTNTPIPLSPLDGPKEPSDASEGYSDDEFSDDWGGSA